METCFDIDINALSDTAIQQLTAIDTSLYYIDGFIVSSLINVFILKKQRKQILYNEFHLPFPSFNPCCLRLIASLITITGMRYFLNVSYTQCITPTTDPAKCKSNELNHLSNLLVMLAILIRYQDLTTTCFGNSGGNPPTIE